MLSQDAVVASHLCRVFQAAGGRRAVALDDVSFSVAAGEFVAYLGPNGAGKSTTVKICAGILHPSSGSVSVAGFSPQRRRVEVARRIGAVFGQKTQLWWDLPVRDSYELLAAMYRVPRDEAAARLRVLDDVLDLSPLLPVPVRRLSLGQRMRADLAAALLHAPAVVFLDEPTVGLDIVARESVRKFLRECNREGTTLLLTTHDMADVEALCTRVIVLGGGRVRYDGPVDRLQALAALPTEAVVELAGAAPPELRSAVGEEEPFRILRVDGAVVEVAFDRARGGIGRVLSFLGRFGEVRDIRLTEPDLEAAMRAFYRDG